MKTKNSWSDCSESGNILRPVKGNAILFFTRHLNATLDQTSTHFRCPVLKGELLVATKLIYAKKQARKDEEESGECSDEDESCPRWAELGECKKNPVYMIGSPDYFGTCRKSCNACWFLKSTILIIIILENNDGIIETFSISQLFFFSVVLYSLHLTWVYDYPKLYFFYIDSWYRFITITILKNIRRFYNSRFHLFYESFKIFLWVFLSVSYYSRV